VKGEGRQLDHKDRNLM